VGFSAPVMSLKHQPALQFSGELVGMVISPFQRIRRAYLEDEFAGFIED